MICKHCGTENKDNAKFCTNCGEETGVVDHYITYYPPVVKKKTNRQSSSKNGALISTIVGCIAVILVLLVAIFVSEKDNLFKDDDKKKNTDDIIAENEFPQIQTETSRYAEAKDKEVSAMAIPAEIAEDDKINLNVAATGSHVAVVTAEDESVTYYIPLRSYLTNEEGFDTWGIIDEETGELGANRRSSYDTGVVYVSIQPSIDFIISTEITADGTEPHSCSTTIYSAINGNELYVPVEALAELLGYGAVVYDAENSVIKFTAKGTPVANPENQDEPVGEKTPEKPAENDDELTDAQKKAIEEEEARIKEVEEAKKKQAQEQAQIEAEAQTEAEGGVSANTHGGAGNHVHSYDDQWITITSPTCTEDGRQMRECKTCQNGREIQDVPATGHTYGDSVITKPATCSETGIKEQICTACGDKKTKATPKTEHSCSAWVNTGDGYQISTCNNCGYTKSRQAPASAHNHTWSSWTIESGFILCGETRIETRTCTTCGAQETRDSGVEGMHVTATADSATCMICGKNIH